MIRGAIHAESGTELDKLYFFIAVSVIEPTVVPARKSNAQISFSQIERTLLSFPPPSPPDPSGPAPRRYPIPRNPPVTSLAWQTSLRHFPWHVLFYPFPSVPSRLRPRLKNCPRQKMSAKDSRRIQTKILSSISNSRALFV